MNIKIADTHTENNRELKKEIVQSYRDNFKKIYKMVQRLGHDCKEEIDDEFFKEHMEFQVLKTMKELNSLVAIVDIIVDKI